MDTTTDLTGLDLKLRRVAAGIKVKQLAPLLKVTPSRLSRIESPDYKVTTEMERRHTEALDTFRTSGTSQDAASAA